MDFFVFQIIFAWLKRFSELFDGSANDADMRLNLSLAIKANKVSLFCNQDNKTTAIEGILSTLLLKYFRYILSHISIYPI